MTAAKIMRRNVRWLSEALFILCIRTSASTRAMPVSSSEDRVEIEKGKQADVCAPTGVRLERDEDQYIRKVRLP